MTRSEIVRKHVTANTITAVKSLKYKKTQINCTVHLKSQKENIVHLLIYSKVSLSKL